MKQEALCFICGPLATTEISDPESNKGKVKLSILNSVAQNHRIETLRVDPETALITTHGVRIRPALTSQSKED